MELELGRGDRLVAVAADALGRAAQDVAPVERTGSWRLDVDGVADAERRALAPAGERGGSRGPGTACMSG